MYFQSRADRNAKKFNGQNKMTPKAETRLYVEMDLAIGGSVELDKTQAHYLRSVLRLQAGADIILFNGRDGEWVASLSELGKKNARAKLKEQIRPQSTSPDLWLLFAPLKKSQTDLVVQKATELGVGHIQPTLTKHSNTEKFKLDRAETITISAAEQCERLDIPKVMEPKRLESLLENWPEDRTLFICAEAGPANAVHDVFLSSREENAAILIGPEGGFAISELEIFSQHPFVKMISLGPRVLRAETAVLSVLSCWQAICGDWQLRPPHRADN